MAQYNLGVFYGRGRGVAQSDERAAELYEAAAAQENAMAVCYAQGRGVEQSYERAAQWYEAAAAQGHDAQYNLGQCYKYGEGVAQSYERAVELFEAAAAQGDASKNKQIDTVDYFGLDSLC